MNSRTDRRTSRIRTFYTLMLTQTFSLVGTYMTSIAVGIWVFKETGVSAPVLYTTLFTILPQVISGSLAGVIVDRWNRRYVMLLSDAGQAVATLLLMLSFLSGSFQLWHLYAISFFQGLLGMFQQPAMEASITMLVPKGHLDRANAIRQTSGPAAAILSPIFAGFLFSLIGVTGIMMIDLATFVVAIAALWLIRIPQPRKSKEGAQIAGSMWQEAWGSLQFLWTRRVLFAFVGYWAWIGLLMSGPMNLNTPYILALTGSEEFLGISLTVIHIGVVLGGIAMGIWEGTRPRIHGIMISMLIRSVFVVLYGIVRGPLWLCVTGFIAYFTWTVVTTSRTSILQLKTPPDIQGRVFALQSQMENTARALSLLLTAPLVDRILEPAVGGDAWSTFEPIFGSRPGAGMGLLMAVTSGLAFVGSALFYAHPRIRSMENDLPDHAPVEAEAEIAPGEEPVAEPVPAV